MNETNSFFRVSVRDKYTLSLRSDRATYYLDQDKNSFKISEVPFINFFDSVR